MNPRDEIVLEIDAGDQCDKLAVDRRTYCRLTDDDGPAFHTESPALLSQVDNTLRRSTRREWRSFQSLEQYA